MTKTFTEIKQGLSKTIFLESQFKDFVTKVTANDTYIYQNEETSVHSQGYTGYKKWAEPVACLSRIASNYSSAKKLKEIIKEEPKQKYKSPFKIINIELESQFLISLYQFINKKNTENKITDLIDVFILLKFLS